MKPYVVFRGGFKGKYIVLPIIFPDQNRKTVGCSKYYGLSRCIGLLFARRRLSGAFNVSAVSKLAFNFGNILACLGAIQLIAYRFKVTELLFSFLYKSA